MERSRATDVSGYRARTKPDMPDQCSACLCQLCYSSLLLAHIAAASSLVALSSGSSFNLKISFLSSNPQLGYAVGQSDVLQTIDGGTTWTPLTTGFSKNLYDIAVVDSNIAVGVGAAGDGTNMLRTADAGASWTAVGPRSPQRELYGVDFPTSTVGFAVGYRGNILRSTTAGSTWTATGNPLQGAKVKHTAYLGMHTSLPTRVWASLLLTFSAHLCANSIGSLGQLQGRVLCEQFGGVCGWPGRLRAIHDRRRHELAFPANRGHWQLQRPQRRPLQQ